MMPAAGNRYWCALILCLGLASTGLAGNVKRIEQDDPSIKYVGQWFAISQAPMSGGSAIQSNADCADSSQITCTTTATLTFTGSGITWIGLKDSNTGLASVYLDGTQYTVDSWAPNTIYQAPVFTARGLDGGKHTITVQVLHQRDPNTTTGSYVWIDGFDISDGNSTNGQTLAPSGLVQQNDPSITYTGNWFLTTNSIFSGGTVVEATDVASSVTITFEGSGITWIGYQDPYSGIANVYIDGAKVATIDTYSAVGKAQSAIYTATNLGKGNGAHTMTIEATGTHDPASTESWVWVDAFNISDK